MTIGLDLGCDQFRSIRAEGGELIARCCPAVFAAISDTPAHRRLLQQASTRFATCSSHLLVFGDAAREWSSMLNLPEIPLFREGRLTTSDAVSRQVLSLMIDAILPTSAGTQPLCRMTLPSGATDARSQNPDGGFLQQLVTLRGYRPQVITSTLALALAELNDSAFSGIAISLGHGTTEFGIIHCGRELLRCVVMAGLEQFADLPKLGSASQSVADLLALPSNAERDYARFFAEVISEAKSQFERDGTIKTLPKSLPVVCSGAITAVPNFLPLFQQVWNEIDWPMSTKPIRVSSDSNLAIARGCLIQAELDQPSERTAA